MFYGSKICKDLKVVFSFQGIPSTTKINKFNGITLDVLCNAVNIPTQQNQNKVLPQRDHMFQYVNIYDSDLPHKKWMNLNQGYAKANQGKLTIGVYSMLDGKKYQQIGLFECDSAVVTHSDAVGNMEFLCTGKIYWSANCKTLTDNDSKTNWYCEWDNNKQPRP